ncbi:hypothetical protein BFW01_g8066 [Lasiodiplodia theobromae]|nr:hypothetical protein BFW01_g8066 [Lasiodiplodia theobromae]
MPETYTIPEGFVFYRTRTITVQGERFFAALYKKPGPASGGSAAASRRALVGSRQEQQPRDAAINYRGPGAAGLREAGLRGMTAKDRSAWGGVWS